MLTEVHYLTHEGQMISKLILKIQITCYIIAIQKSEVCISGESLLDGSILFSVVRELQ